MLLGKRGSTPAAKLAGKVVDGLGGQPLASAKLRFHPKDSGGMPAFAATRDDGTFNVGTFSRDDGIIPGNYVVTIESIGRTTAAFIPSTYQSAKTSPLRFDIKPDDEAQPTIKLK